VTLDETRALGNYGYNLRVENSNERGGGVRKSTQRFNQKINGKIEQQNGCYRNKKNRAHKKGGGSMKSLDWGRRLGGEVGRCGSDRSGKSREQDRTELPEEEGEK